MVCQFSVSLCSNIMTKTDMAKLPGLFQREAVYQLRVVIPLDLRTTYSGKTKLVQSLNTKSPREAALAATQERAKRLEEFQDRRRALQPQRLDSVTPEMSAELAQRVRAGVLRLDDEARENPRTREALRELYELVTHSPLKALTIASIKPKPTPLPANLACLLGLSAGEASALASLNDIRSDAAGINLAVRNLQAILPLVKEEAHKLGLTFDPQSPGAREALQAALKAYRQACKEVTQRDAGEIIDTPAVQLVSKSTTKPPRLRDVFERWKASKPRSPDSWAACMRSLVLYEGFTGNPPLAQLTRQQGDGFRTWLQHPDRKTTSKTAHDRLTWAKSLLKYASRDLELMPKNPWEGLEIAHRTTNKRRPWTDAELVTFFTQPLHAAYKLSKAKRAGADAAYWIPLLGLYTGARIGELCQLRVSDLEVTKGIHALSISDEGEGQIVKTDAGVRKVPVHPELVRLGFLDYVEALRLRREVLMWPRVLTRVGKPGDLFGRWFKDYRKAAPIGFGELPDFHCLRHTVRTQMAEAEVTEQTMDSVIGHEITGSTGSKVYTHRTLEAMQRAISVLSYPMLALPVAYRKA